MIDRDRLREALAYFPHDELPDDPTATDHDVYAVIVEAARLVASPDTLIVEKVDGAWPEWALDAAEHWETFTAEDGERSLRTKPPCDVLDALLAQQGTTK